ncbi:MAG: family 78 glycoside hydrolase catalytic domain [Clostridia bacterium]|nr:family 78 glycoside hydrolase catalytic domain [Clostridia bacterium]
MEKNFIKATEKYCDVDSHVAAPLIRKSFMLDSPIISASVSVCGLGFYRLFVNGREITKGHLAPYISNPDDICYYDTYDLSDVLSVGENVIGVILGNGFMNCFGGAVWDFEKAVFRGAPRLALEFFAATENGELSFCADSSFKTHPSPILFDDLRLGEIYDAREELEGWAEIGFDDSNWQKALTAETPRGEMKLCRAEPIAVIKELSPVSVTKQGDAYLYDFGINTAGVCRLNVSAESGQKITLWHGEILKDGQFYNANILFKPEKYTFYNDYNQTVRYIASGKGREVYTPSFSYQGFRYVLVEGITEAQATPELLTYLVMSSDLKTVGGFSCSDDKVNKLYNMAVNADRSNFFYFPTDCPHREKNGWTGDASMSSDRMVLMYDVDTSWRVWLDNIRKAQNDRGELPGIVPTSGWGFKWGNGPTWDSALFNLPYMLYKFRGDTDVIRENAHAMVRYLQYILTRRNENGTVSVGLGDYVPVGKVRASDYDAPVALTDSVMVMDVARKANEMFSTVGYTHEADYALGIYEDMRETIRRELVDTETMTVAGNCQSSQCISLYYGVFDKDEEQTAFERLLEFIDAKNGAFDCGFIGMHTIFHVLTRFGRSDIAYKMITGREYPSYGRLIDVGETAVVEKFMPDPINSGSHNHHFLADYARWLTYNVAGLEMIDSHTVKVAPADIDGIDFAEAWYDLPCGRVSVGWKRGENGEKTINVTVPDGVKVIN